MALQDWPALYWWAEDVIQTLKNAKKCHRKHRWLGSIHHNQVQWMTQGTHRALLLISGSLFWIPCLCPIILLPLSYDWPRQSEMFNLKLSSCSSRVSNKPFPVVSFTLTNPTKCSAIFAPTGDWQFTMRSTKDSCSLWLISGVQSIITETYFAFLTFWRIASFVFSPTNAMSSFWMMLLKWCLISFFSIFLRCSLIIGSICAMSSTCPRKLPLWGSKCFSECPLSIWFHSAKWQTIAIILLKTAFQCCVSRACNSWLLLSIYFPYFSRSSSLHQVCNAFCFSCS